jgi:mannosyltransferase
MATYASQPAWELRARAVSSARLAAPVGLGLLLALSLLLRTRALDVGFWIDEGLSVGISDRPLGDISSVLRQDGSPPLYYVLLHFWLDLAGRSESSVHMLSVIFGLLCIPVAYWAGGLIFGRRTAWVAAVLAAFNPYLTQFAQEGRMYSLLALLGLVSLTCWLQAFTTDAPAADAGEAAAGGVRGWGGIRTAPAIGFGVAFAAMLYTHNWALFFGIASGVAWLVLLALAGGPERARLLRTGLLAYGLVVLLYLPWLPTALYQAAHTGAPWSKAPSLAALVSTPARLLGVEAEIALFLAAGAGLAVLLGRRHAGRLTAPGRAVVALLLMAVLTIVVAWLASQLSPAWANRYLSAALAPWLLLCAAGLAYAGRLGLVGLALVAVLWAIQGAPDQKSNVRDVTQAIAPSLRPGDLVVSTQPEQVSVLNYYLPSGLRYATLTGRVPDVGVTDWRDGVERLKATSPQRDLAPLLDRLPSGSRVALVQPIFYYLGRWSAPWTEQVRLKSEQWEQFLSNDRRFGVVREEPASTLPARPNPVRATVYVKR